MKYLRDYILESLANGKCFFTKEEAMFKLQLNPIQFRFQAYRLVQKQVIKHLVRGFYMIVPPEYQNMSVVPAHWIIDPLMKYLNQNYYIGLLSAASMYGSTNQQPMLFQVITDKPHRAIQLGRSSIKFFNSKTCSNAIAEQISSNAGYANISSREQTILDLIRFYQSSGYFSNVASVIKDLAQDAKEDAFVRAIQNEKSNSILQRLGYILELTEFRVLSSHIQAELKCRTIQFIPLNPDIKTITGDRIKEFKIIKNDSLEIE